MKKSFATLLAASLSASLGTSLSTSLATSLCISLIVMTGSVSPALAKTNRAAKVSQPEDELDDDSGSPKKATYGPASEAHDFDSDEIGDLQDEQATIENKIQVTKQEIGRVRDASYLPDLYFALADMHVQKARILYLLKVAKNPRKNAAELDFTAEKRPKIDAIEIYQKIYSFFPKEKRRDKALFYTGLEQRDLGQFENMVRTFTKLSTEFPTSEHFNEANIIVGDYLFESKKDLEAAIEVFRKVVNRPVSAFTPLAHYRIGWCYINLSKYEDAVKSFEDSLLTQAQVNPSELPETYRRTDIRREAVLSLAVPYVEIYSDPDKKRADLPAPVDYFRQKSPDHFTYRRVLARAGKRLILKERWKESADAFYHVLALSTDFDARFDALQKVNEAYKRKAAQIDYLAFIKEVGITYDLLQASLSQPLAFTAKAMLAADKKKPDRKSGENMKKTVVQLQFLELLMRDFATQMHKKARATGSPEDFNAASEAYWIYLSRFPDAPKALDIEFNLAEARFKSDRLVQAGMQYETLARDPRLKKRASQFKESAIESFTKALTKADQLTAVDRIRARRGLRSIGGDWLKENPKAAGAPSAAFNIANSWYEERNLRKAIESFRNFVRLYPKDDHVRDAIFLTINCYSQMDDYKGLQATGAQLIKTAGLSAADQATVQDAIRRAQTKQLQTTAGDFGSKEYAENLLSVASKYKGSALGVQALYEAFNSLKSKKDPELFEVGEALLDQHADSQYAKEVTSSMATLALSTASFDRGARYLSRYADKFPKEPEALEFRKTSALLFERQGDFKKARAQYEKLGDRAALARMDLLVNDWPRLEKSSLASGLREAKYWKALAVWRQHRYQDAAPLLRELAANTSIPPEQSGHAKFLLVQLPLERFRSIEMKSAEDQAALMAKVKAFQVLSGELQTIVKSAGGRWPIAALYILGQAHYDLGRFIANSPLPAGLSDVDKKTYIGELNGQAATYMAEATNVFKKCVETAQANDVFTRYVNGCRAKGQKQIKEEDDLARPQLKAAGAEPPRAREIRKRLIDDSKNLDLLQELGETYVHADQPQTASGIFSRVLELDPGNARAIAAVGVALLDLNDFDGAYDQFTKALKSDPKSAIALYNLAALYGQFGFKEKLGATRSKMSGIGKPKLLHTFTAEN